LFFGSPNRDRIASGDQQRETDARNRMQDCNSVWTEWVWWKWSAAASGGVRKLRTWPEASRLLRLSTHPANLQLLSFIGGKETRRSGASTYENTRPPGLLTSCCFSAAPTAIASRAVTSSARRTRGTACKIATRSGPSCSARTVHA